MGRLRWIPAFAGMTMLLASIVTNAQVPYQPQPASPPKDAGYVLADGTIQIVGWDDLAGMFANLNALYARTHPGTKLGYGPGNLMAPQHSLIFGETAYAPMELSKRTSRSEGGNRRQVAWPEVAVDRDAGAHARQQPHDVGGDGAHVVGVKCRRCAAHKSLDLGKSVGRSRVGGVHAEHLHSLGRSCLAPLEFALDTPRADPLRHKICRTSSWTMRMASRTS